jgi:hypothetical protein
MMLLDGIGGNWVTPSCAGLTRASTAFFEADKDVNGRVKPGHDDEETSVRIGKFYQRGPASSRPAIAGKGSTPTAPPSAHYLLSDC